MPRMETKLRGVIKELQDCSDKIEQSYNKGVIDGFDDACDSKFSEI